MTEPAGKLAALEAPGDPFVYLEKVRVEFPFHKDAARGLRKVKASTPNTKKDSSVDSEAGASFLKTGRRFVAAALDDIDLSIKAGDRLGLMGHNGAGKSTLIRVISGLLQPSSGRLLTVGRVASTISTTFGFDMSLSGRENVLRRGLMMRLNADEIAAKTQDILDFSELGHYIDMPMSTYSSGMKARLGFAITTSVEADILVMDEWIGAGDPRFIEKCENRLAEMVDKSRILILATHKERLLKRVCNRFAILEKGQLREVTSEDGLESNYSTDEEKKTVVWRDKAEHYRNMAVQRGEKLQAKKEKVIELREKLKRTKDEVIELRAEIRSLD